MHRKLRTLTVALVAAAAVLALPAQSLAATLVAPAAGAHLEWTQVRPNVAFDPAEGEQPKWVLLALDAEMKQTVRYCRQFSYVAVEGAYHYGCNVWAVGVDGYGQDVPRNVEWNKTYYAQVISTKDTVEVKSEVRAFTIDNVPDAPNPGAVSDQAFGTAFGDGTELNLGAAAFINSGLKTNSIKSFRVKRARFRIEVRFSGPADISKSYIKVKSKAGTHNVQLTPYGPNRARGIWKMTSAEQHLRTRKYSYQAFIKSTKNGALVRTHQMVMLITTSKQPAPPAWTPT